MLPVSRRTGHMFSLWREWTHIFSPTLTHLHRFFTPPKRQNRSHTPRHHRDHHRTFLVTHRSLSPRLNRSSTRHHRDSRSPSPRLSRSSTRHHRDSRRHHRDHHSSPSPPRRLNRVLCYNCDKPGHIAQHCPEGGIVCFLCGERGHLKRDCRHELCYRCGAPGHKASNCPKVSGNVEEKSTDIVVWMPRHELCYRCGAPGHKASNCPKVSGNVEEKSTDIVVWMPSPST